MLPMALFTFTLITLLAYSLRFLSRRANWQDLSYWATALGPFMPFLLLYVTMIFPWPDADRIIPVLFFPFNRILVTTPHDHALISFLGIAITAPIIEGQAFILIMFYSLLGGYIGYFFYLQFTRPKPIPGD